MAVLVVPLSFGMDFAVGWPLFAVMNSHASGLAMSLVSLLPIALCAGELWIVSSYISKPETPEPLEPHGTTDPTSTGPITVTEPVPTGAGV